MLEIRQSRAETIWLCRNVCWILDNSSKFEYTVPDFEYILGEMCYTGESQNWGKFARPPRAPPWRG